MTQLLCFLVPPAIALLLTLRDKNCRSSPVFLIGRWFLYALGIYCTVGLIRGVTGRAGMQLGYTEGGFSFLYIHYGMSSIAIAGAISVMIGLIEPLLRRKLSIREQVVLREKRRIGASEVCARAVIHAFMLTMLLLTFACIWGMSTFGSVSFEQIWFHINMPLEGTGSEVADGIVKNVIGFSLIAFLAFELLCFFPSRKQYQIRGFKKDKVLLQILPLRMPHFIPALLCLIIWFAVMFQYADRYFGFTTYVRNQMDQSELFVNDYVDPRTVELRFPEKKRNLITIYLESCETSAQDAANGGLFEDRNYIPELTQLAKENISFSHSDKLEGAAVAPACGWTIAGLVAQTAGLPLKMYGFSNANVSVDNEMEVFASFMPGATTLGDILERQGYRNVFMAGSDFTFGGRRTYYRQHGDYEILDYLAAIEQGVIAQDYFVNWGFEDRILYGWAKEKLTELAQGSEPFNFTMLTVDTHTPDGYICSECPDMYEDQYGNVLACSSAQLWDFIQWCSQQEFYENTSIVITGDHASMVAGFYESEYEKHKGDTERKVYNVFINSAAKPEKENNRLFTTLDIFPSTLASLGVEIEGDRLGLGTNLFSDKPTLSEQYGYETLFAEMLKKSNYYNENILFP